MSIATSETSSRIDEADVQTRGIDPASWVLPSLEPERLDATTRSDFDSEDQAATASLPGNERRIIEPIRKDRLAFRFPAERVRLLQQWECVVQRTDNECVECEMYDLTNEASQPEYASIYLDEFNLFDRPLLEDGAVFYWSIGHEIRKTGTVRRYSELRVRRMPKPSKLQQREFSQRAKEVGRLFNIED
jgi:hypothetical protein